MGDWAGPDPLTSSLQLAGATLDPSKNTITFRGASVHLTGRESELLAFFLKNPDRYFTAQQLLTEAWNAADHSPDEVRVYIRRLRLKVDRLPPPFTICSQKWLGYCLSTRSRRSSNTSPLRESRGRVSTTLARLLTKPGTATPLPLRWAGLTGSLGGILAFAAVAIGLVNPHAGGIWSGDLFRLPALLSVPMLAIGWVAAYLTQAEWAGRLGACGFLLWFAALVAWWPTFIPNVSDAGELVQLQDGLAIRGTGLEASTISRLAAIGLSLGLVITGLATCRAGVFPRWAGLVLLAVGSLTLGGVLVRLLILQFLSTAATSVVIALLGYITWLTSSHSGPVQPLVKTAPGTTKT